MTRKLLITATLLALALPAAADFRTVQLAHEVALSEIRLPQSESGTLAFRTCDSCDFRTERVTPETRYLLNGKAIPLEKFRIALSRVQDRESMPVTVLHHLEKDRITQVSVYL
jgi:hypothetical protein